MEEVNNLINLLERSANIILRHGLRQIKGKATALAKS